MNDDDLSSWLRQCSDISSGFMFNENPDVSKKIRRSTLFCFVHLELSNAMCGLRFWWACRYIVIYG